MSLNKEAYIRYKIIDSTIRNIQFAYPSINCIIKNCEERLGKTFSISTIQKDIKAMKEDEGLGFLAPIKFSKSQNGYYYSNPDFSINQIPLQENEINALITAGCLLQTISGSRIGNSFDTAVNKIVVSLKEKLNKEQSDFPLVFMDSPPKQIGWEYFELLYSAIKNKTAFSFISFHFIDRNFSTDILHPYQLIEFKNHWYIIGYSENKKDISVCSLDRLFSPIELKLPFNNSKVNEVEKYNTDMYGCHPIFGQKKQKIKFAAAYSMANYLNAHPLHLSQKSKLIDIRGVYEFTINVIPTHELISWFFTYSNDINVKKSSFIYIKIKEKIKDISNWYLK